MPHFCDQNLPFNNLLFSKSLPIVLVEFEPTDQKFVQKFDDLSSQKVKSQAN